MGKFEGAKPKEEDPNAALLAEEDAVPETKAKAKVKVKARVKAVTNNGPTFRKAKLPRSRRR